MTVFLVVLMFVGFVVIDVLIRRISARMDKARTRREREEVLHTAIKLDFSHEAPSLKRVEVQNPKARILAVDDERVILDSFRKILVVAGYSTDTVESGREALGLVQRHDYDFVFTDLRMPGMDGVEVVKGIKHLRPDIDVAVVTGYGAIETAVETMQYGAVDYVQKPFTEEELVEFTRRLMIKREARLEALRRPTVRVVTPASAETAAAHEFCVPGGAFVSDGHAWARLERGGEVRIGLDDFARKALRSAKAVELPAVGKTIHRGEPLFSVSVQDRKVVVAAPLGGRVLSTNQTLSMDPEQMIQSPYDHGWVCIVEPLELAAELPALRIGRPVIDWYQEEIARLRDFGKSSPEGIRAEDLETFEKTFLKPRMPAPV